jgi:predicted anti-sigma-YlaC factor YlaD
MRRRRTARRAGALPCEVVRVAISAGLDGEVADLSGAIVAAHVAGCPGCRRFQEGAAVLQQGITLRASRPPPAALKERLAGEWVETVAVMPPPVAGRSRRSVPRPGWHRTIRWAGVLVPAAALVVALPLGALSAAQGKPSHASTPCTRNLRSPWVSPP